MIGGMRFASPLSHDQPPNIDEYVFSFTISKSPKLQARKLETLKLLNDFNDPTIPDGSTVESLKMRRIAVARNLLGKIGENVNIEPPFFVGWGCNTFLGNGVYINRE